MRPRAFSDILAKVPGARPSGDRFKASCPCPGHATPNGHLSLKDAGDKALIKCYGLQHTYQEICSALGFDSLDYSPDGTSPGKRSKAVTRYPVRNPSGQVVAVHVRRDKLSGKVYHWELPDGTTGLGGMRVEDLPLYGSEHLAGLPDVTPLAVVEGEKAAQALIKHGIPAVGSVTGAGATPGREALWPLVRLAPILWADNDEVGRQHMTRIAARLQGLGCEQLRRLSWAEAPPGGDAADALLAGVDIAALLQQAAPLAAVEAEGLASLLTDVEAFIRRYVIVSGPQAVVLTLWVLHTHAIEVAAATPYLHITSPEKQSGKTLLLEVLTLLVAKPWFTSRASAAVLVRRVARDAPTLLLDESDAAFKSNLEYSEALRGILNAGYRKGGVASLCVSRGADYDLVDLPVFCPKAIAGIGKLPDTVADRSIQITLKRRALSEKVSRFRLREVKSLAQPLRERLERWANGAIAKLADACPELPDELSDRAADVWEPLLAIADMAGDQWPERARESAMVLAGAAVEDNMTQGVLLLADVHEVLQQQGSPIASVDLVAALVKREESPWGDLRGRPLDARHLARLLKPYGVRPKPVRMGAAVVKGYTRADFHDAFVRYLRMSEITVTSDTTVTNSQPRREFPGMGIEDVTDATDVTVPGDIREEGTHPPFEAPKAAEPQAPGAELEEVLL